MLATLRISSRMLVVMTVVTGGMYPLLVTAIAHLGFSHQAGGSLIVVRNRAVGSELIGQSFSSPRYFWGRLSATLPVPYNASASGGSNYGPRNPRLREAAQARIASLIAAGTNPKEIPIDLVTASGSGLDPHISKAAAEYQLARVAAARGLAQEQVRELVRRHTLGRQVGIFGEPRVHVLRLNLALDELPIREE